MRAFTYGAYTYQCYGGRLVEIKVIAENKREAYAIAYNMCDNSNYIDTDEGVFLNDEYDC